MKHFTGAQAAAVRREFVAYELSEKSPLWSYYLQDGYFVINNALRYNIITPRLVAIVNSMLQLMAPLPRAVTLYRGLRFKQDFKVGNSFSDAAFLSTTLDQGLAWGISHDILKLSVPNNIPIAYLSSELEIVLPPGCKFVVDEVDNDYDGRGHSYVSLSFVSLNTTELIATVPELDSSHNIDNDLDYLDILAQTYNLSQYDFDAS